MRLRIVLSLSYILLSSGYIQLSSLKSKLFHKVLINSKIKSDFKKITSNDAYQVACFWHDELVQACSDEERNHQISSLLYRPTSKHIFDNSVNLTDFKYSIISDVENKNQYYIWRPKIQICLPSLRSIEIDKRRDEIKKTLLYPSFRETMYLLSLEARNDSETAIINNIVQSPYWSEPKYDSYKIMQYSVDNFFVGYLKYRGLKYK